MSVSDEEEYACLVLLVSCQGSLGMQYERFVGCLLFKGDQLGFSQVLKMDESLRSL